MKAILFGIAAWLVVGCAAPQTVEVPDAVQEQVQIIGIPIQDFIKSYGNAETIWTPRCCNDREYHEYVKQDMTVQVDDGIVVGVLRGTTGSE